MLRQKDYPKTIMVGDSEWRVRFVRAVPEKADVGRVVVGLCDGGTQTIYVRQRLGPVERLDTFVHELIHAFEDEYELTIPHGLVYALAEAFTAFLVANHLPGAPRRARPKR